MTTTTSADNRPAMTALYALAASKDGWTLHSGPYRLAEATDLIDRHLTPNGWEPVLTPLTRPDVAIKHFTAAKNPQPVEGADLFVALRRAMLCDPKFDGADCSRGGALIAHVDAHRPVVMYVGDEECMLSECDHDTQDDRCPIEPVDRWCLACTPSFHDGGEYGTTWFEGCQIVWPCAPVRAVAGRYGVPLDEWEAKA